MAFGRPEKIESEGEVSSKIRLESYVVGTADKILHGLPRLSSAGKFNIEVNSVELAPGLVPPAGLLVALYGFRDAAEMLRAAKDSWQKYEGADFRPVSFDFEVGKIAPYVIPLNDEETPDDKKDPIHHGIGATVDGKPVHRFLNIMRTKSQVQDYINTAFNGYAQADGEEFIEKRIPGIATRPHYWARLLEEDPLFQNIEILVVPIATKKEQGDKKIMETKQFALVSKRAKLLEVIQNTKPLIQAVAPRWLTGEMEVRKLPVRKMPVPKAG